MVNGYTFAMNADAHWAGKTLKGPWWLAIVAGLILVLAAACFYSMANSTRRKVAADAVVRIGDQGQEIVNAAFPARIGAAPFRGVVINGVQKQDDGYQALATLFYTNLVLDDNHLEIEMSYDPQGAFRGARIRHCNDRWAMPTKLIDLAGR